MERLQRQDLRTIARLVALGLITGTVPEQYWLPLRERLSKLARSLRKRRDDTGDLLLARLEQLATGETGAHAEWRERARRTLRWKTYEDTLFILRDYWPRGWNPELRVSGVQHVNAALEAGTGAVLWVGHFGATRLAWKKALHASGVKITHLSAPKHGFSHTPFGVRFINPVCTHVERRYLLERVPLLRNEPVRALRRLRARLDENGVVSMTDTPVARNMIQIPFLGVTRLIGPGAPSLALAAGAGLFPVFPIRTGERTFEIVVEPAIIPPTGVSRREAVSAMVHEYAARLERYVREQPEAWAGWFSVNWDQDAGT